MTTAPTNAAGRVKTPEAGGHFRFPDPPEIPEDKMTSFNQLTPNGTAHHLVQHLGNPDTTLVAGEHYLSLVPTRRHDRRPLPRPAGGLRSGPGRPTTTATPTSSRRQGQAAGLCAGDSLAQQPPGRPGWTSGRTTPRWASRSTGGLTRQPASEGEPASGRPAGGRRLRTHRHRGVVGRRAARIQRGAEPVPALGARPDCACTTRPQASTSPPSRAKGSGPTPSERPA